MTVQDEVQAYVTKRPYIQEALAQDIINFSALARSIEEEIDGGFEAIKMALRRYQKERAEQRIERQQAITELLGDTSVELKHNVTVCKTDTAHPGAVIHAVTTSGPTWIIEGSHQNDHTTITDQVLVTLRSPANLEEVPGVLAYILSLLAGRGINVTELVSCREDTHLIVDETDAIDTYELLTAKL